MNQVELIFGASCGVGSYYVCVYSGIIAIILYIAIKFLLHKYSKVRDVEIESVEADEDESIVALRQLFLHRPVRMEIYMNGDESRISEREYGFVKNIQVSSMPQCVQVQFLHTLAWYSFVVISLGSNYVEGSFVPSYEKSAHVVETNDIIVIEHLKELPINDSKTIREFT